MASSAPTTWVSIEGLIGAGKSTLLSKVRDARVVPEPISPLLAQSYQKPDVYSFPVQCDFFHRRIQAFRRACGEMPESGAPSPSAPSPLIFTDRSPYSDKLFWQLKLDRGDVDAALHATYLDMWSMWQELLPLPRPTLFVYLRTPVASCMARVKSRDRLAETAFADLETYNQQLQDAHDTFLLDPAGVLMPDGTRVPCLLIETEANFRDDEDAAQELVGRIYTELKKLEEEIK